MSRWLYYGSYCTPHSFESFNVSTQWRMGRSSSSMPWQAFSAFCLRFLLKLEGFSYDLEMKTREQNRNDKRSKVERFGWFIERIKTRLAFCWLSERSGKKTSCPRTSRNQQILRFNVILQPDWLIYQRLLHVRIFFGGKTKKPYFDFFIHWLIN